jgi:hypothetical protein
MKALRVRDWQEIYENHRTRELKDIKWVPVPNKLDGDGYTALMDHPNGAAHYGAWMAMLLIASKCSERGLLCVAGPRGKAPMTARIFARLSRLPAETFEEVIPRLLSDDIYWLEEVDLQQDTGVREIGAEKRDVGAEKRDPCAEVRDATAEERKKEGKEGREDSTCPDLTPIAKRIHARHRPGRKGTLQAYERTLAQFVSGAVDPLREAQSLDARHAQNCESDEWTRESGRFVPGLDKWTLEHGHDEPHPRKAIPLAAQPTELVEWGNGPTAAEFFRKFDMESAQNKNTS